MKYNKLRNPDLFLLSAIVDKTGIEIDFDEIKKMMSGKKNTKKNQQEGLYKVGFQLMWEFIKKMHKAQDEFTELISNVTGKSKEEVQEMSVNETKEVLTHIMTQEGVMDFFTSGKSDQS